MTRWRRTVGWSVAILAVTVGLTGCGRPAGVDGDLVDDWRPVSAPEPFVPPSDVCHVGGHKDSNVELAANFRPVDCAQEHGSETVYVGRFPAALNDRVTPPPAGSPGHRAAYAECDKRATAFVGAEWREGRLALGVVMPSKDGWRGGARWFRCDLTEMYPERDFPAGASSFGPGERRTGSLKGALRGASRLRLGCYTYDKSVQRMPAVACTRPHNLEFVGIYAAPDTPYPETTAAWDRLYRHCRSVIAKYVRVPDDGSISYRSGVYASPFFEADWKAGNRGVRCFLWLDERMVSRSLKGAGVKGLPFY
jgi:hypothetical protein